MARDTRTGSVLESMILPALTRGGYEYERQVRIGTRLGGGSHFVDVVATDSGGKRLLVSLKWQQVSGTAEQKVPFEILCLSEALRENAGKFDRAYLVLGGPGWKLRDYYIKGGLDRHLLTAADVKIIGLEEFIAKANTGSL